MGEGRKNVRRKSESTQWQRHGVRGFQEGCAPAGMKGALIQMENQWEHQNATKDTSPIGLHSHEVAWPTGFPD